MHRPFRIYPNGIVGWHWSISSNVFSQENDAIFLKWWLISRRLLSSLPQNNWFKAHRMVLNELRAFWALMKRFSHKWEFIYHPHKSKTQTEIHAYERKLIRKKTRHKCLHSIGYFSFFLVLANNNKVACRFGFGFPLSEADFLPFASFNRKSNFGSFYFHSLFLSRRHACTHSVFSSVLKCLK